MRRSASRSDGWTSTARSSLRRARRRARPPERAAPPRAPAATPPGTVVPAPFAVTQDLINQFGYGYAAGVGIDICLMANLFARVEYEYVQFPDFQGLNAHMHNVRVGAALKF